MLKPPTTRPRDPTTMTLHRAVRRRVGWGARSALLAAGLLASGLPGSGRPLQAQSRAPVLFSTAPDTTANVDSCAVWAAQPPDEPLLFVTEKDGDRVQVHHADTGLPYEPKPYLGGPQNSALPGEFNRPNGIWVLYHVPLGAGFSDVLLVTDQENSRVQVFRLPELTYAGEFGTGEVGRGYGIAWYTDGTDLFVYISDYTPPASSPGKVKEYRLKKVGDQLGADLVRAFGSDGGVPPIGRIESILADFAHDRLHVCGDEGGRFNRIFRLDGSYTGVEYGDPQFEFDQEGINLYDTGQGRGYLIVSDQYTNGSPNQFELFERDSLAPLGNFTSSPGAYVTRNTDGAYLEQRPFAGFPNGGFFAVNDDRSTHAYDWTDIAASMDLEIVPLDRPFAGTEAAGLAPPAVSRASLWHHDGSWWGLMPRGDRLALSRLEDGTFEAMGDFGAAVPASAAARGGDLLVLRDASPLEALTARYDPSTRSYETTGSSSLGVVDGDLAEGALEMAPGGPRGWVAVVSGEEVRVLWRADSVAPWDASGVSLGAALPVLPRLLVQELPGGAGMVAVLWAAADGVRTSLRQRSAPLDEWPAAELVDPAVVTAIAAAALPDGRLLVVGADSGGAAWSRARAAGGGWGGRVDLGTAHAPALVLDPATSDVHLLFSERSRGHGRVLRRVAAGGSAPFGPEELLLAWPSVSLDGALFPRDIPDDAPDLVIAALGDDGLGRFGRVALPRDEDLAPPITLQHQPSPGAEGVEEGATVRFRVTDDRSGVNRASLRLIVGGVERPASVRGVDGNLLVSWKLPADLAGPLIEARIEAADRSLLPRVMTPFEWSFRLASTGGEPALLRGDSNGDGERDLSDAVRTLLGLFAGLPLSCLDAADANDDGGVDVSDPVYLLHFLFLGGAAPPAPSAGCGLDPTGDTLGCDIPGC